MKEEFKVKITTVRKLYSTEEFYSWIKQLNEAGIPVDGDELYATGSWTRDNKSCDEDVATKYEIMDED